MTATPRVSVSIRILGESLEPAEVSALLGATPTHSFRKGDPIQLGGTSGAKYGLAEGDPAPTGAWVLVSSSPEQDDLEDQLEALLSECSKDPDEWASLTSRFSASIKCEWRFGDRDTVFEITPRLSQSLAERGLVISFEVHAD